MKLTLTRTLGGITALAAVVLAGGAVELSANQACAASPAPSEYSFSQDILPLLEFRCGRCHKPGGEGYEKSGFDVTSYQTVMAGTKFGPMIVPGNPETSSLMRLLDWGVAPEIRMPHGLRQLSVCDRDQIRTWIFKGAKDN